MCQDKSHKVHTQSVTALAFCFILYRQSQARHKRENINGKERMILIGVNLKATGKIYS
jgi:hypothetical protein